MRHNRLVRLAVWFLANLPGAVRAGQGDQNAVQAAVKYDPESLLARAPLIPDPED